VPQSAPPPLTSPDASPDIDAVETYTPAEQEFERRRRTLGLVLAPALFALVLLLPTGLEPPAHKMAATLTLVVVLWMTEAIPLAVTALLGPAVAVALQVAPVRQAFAAFADPIIFLVLGGFIIARAMLVHGVDRRVVYRALSISLVGASALRILVAYGAMCVLISMWVSNTATTAMMFPIGLSVVAHMRDTGRTTRAEMQRFGMAMMLLTAFAASVGGMATPVGSAPNLIGIGMLDKLAGVRVTFADWVVIAMPIVLLLFAALIAVFRPATGAGLVAEGSAEFVRRELARMGPTTRAQRHVLMVFALAVVLWSVPGLLAIVGGEDTPFGRVYAAAMPESVASIAAASLLFVLPIDWRSRTFAMSWDEASRIDWGTLLLFGGGLAIGDLVFQTGLAKAMGEFVTSWLPAQTTLALTVVFTAAAIVLSETTSNTASANMIVPITIAVAQAAGVRPIEPALGAALGASMGFMMPISTPPNAIVYSSGYVPIGQMIRHGVLLDIIGFVVIVTGVLTIGPILF
jgi:sodium-dependent dicarboxylate transporter 2/3/5